MIILFTNKRKDNPKWEGEKLTNKPEYEIFTGFTFAFKHLGIL